MPTIVEGVLNGPAGGAGNHKGWDLVFELMPWRLVGDEKLPARPLRVEVAMSEKLIRAWMKRLADGATVQLAVRRLEREATFHDGTPAPWSLAIGRLPVRRVKGSATLRAARDARKVPVVIRDEVLGKLVLERQYAWFSGKLAVRGRRVPLSIARSGTTEDRVRDLRDIARARTIVARLERSWMAVDKRIVREKLRLYNETWRERRPALTAKQFVARIRLESIVIGGKRVTLYYRDGGLFLGHAIEVRMTPRGAISEVLLAG